MFDLVRWDDGRRAQTKCWGPLTEYTVGDSVQLDPYISSGEDAGVLWSISDAGEPPFSYQIPVKRDRLFLGSYLTVIDGKLTFWDDERRENLVLVDNRGCPWDGTVGTCCTDITDIENDTPGFGNY